MLGVFPRPVGMDDWCLVKNGMGMKRCVRKAARRKVKSVDQGRDAAAEETAEVSHEEPGASFKTARTKLIEDHYKKFGRNVDEYKAPFLTRKTSGMGAKGKFVNPFPKPALTEPTQQGSGSALSARTINLLSKGTGELPAALKNFDLTLVEAVCSEILDEGAAVEWGDIAGQETAKQLVQEMVVWPMMNPHLFQGTRTPPRGLLLFGPPGTGKTLIGKAIASNIQATFFSISASSLMSKWIGEGEKMVRILFAVAEALQPTVIFIDEIDSILSARKSDGTYMSHRNCDDGGVLTLG